MAKKKQTRKDAIREKLVQQRDEILDLYKHDLKVGQKADDEGSQDIVDQANNAYNRELMLSLSNGERKTLFEIEAAIDRLEDGKYGKCTNCDDDISGERLRAVPWARYCISCQEMVEHGLLDTE